MTTPQEGWNEPKTGWCFDEKTLERRTKVLFNFNILTDTDG
jgi:hypothetical protein